MIERKMKFMYWLCHDQPMQYNNWIETKIHINNWVSFESHIFRINGVVYKKYTKAFKEAHNKELMWEKLK